MENFTSSQVTTPQREESPNFSVFQIQGDKEKLLYELDTLQAELEKCNMSSSRCVVVTSPGSSQQFCFRLQKEKEDAYADIDRGREKYEKLQVRRVCILPGCCEVLSVWSVAQFYRGITPPY